MTNRHTRRWLSTVAVLALAAATQVAVQAMTQQGAAAALPGAVARSAQTDFAPAPSKTITASCPPGTRVTGGTGRVTGFTDHVVLTRMQPMHTNNPDTPDGYTVTAIEDETEPGGQWAVTAYALCAATTPGHAVQIVSDRSDSGSPQNEREVVDCPPGKVVLGSGVRINGGAGQVHVTEMTMGGSANGRHRAFVTAQENHDGFGGQWSLDAYAVCANIPLDDYVVLTGFAPGPGSADEKVATVTCPAGMTVTGGGAQISEGFSGRVVMERIIPEFLVGGIPGREVAAVAREEIINDSFWSLSVVAACVR
jgi:hypothetical protein